MSEVSTIGLDIAKHVFHAHGADALGHQIFSRKISRGKLLDFFAGQARCLVALEACGGAHHWARELMRLGHEVRLIPPAYVIEHQSRSTKTLSRHAPQSGLGEAHHRWCPSPRPDWGA